MELLKDKPPVKIHPHKKRCHYTSVTNIINLPSCCPVSGNPEPGSIIEICYVAIDAVLEVAALQEYIKGYESGRGDVRSMEEMVENITRDCALALGVKVTCTARLNIAPNQKMEVKCTDLGIL